MKNYLKLVTGLWKLVLLERVLLMDLKTLLAFTLLLIVVVTELVILVTEAAFDAELLLLLFVTWFAL